MATPIPKNDARFSLGEVLAIVGGALHDVDVNDVVIGVTTDSRSVSPGELFVALSGESFDGHRFVEGALAAGAKVALVRRGTPVSGPRVEVADTLAAFGLLGRAYFRRVREAAGAPCVAIGGAVGKTTTKTLLAAGVSAAFGETLATLGNLNNRVGVPSTLLLASPKHAAHVIECGTSEKGEIAVLGELVEPDVALVLNVDVEHTEGLGTLEDVADEEAALFLCARRRCVTNADDARLMARRPRGLETFTFGRTDGADVRLVERRWGGERQSVVLAVGGASGTTIRADLRLVGEAAALNFAAAVAAILAMLPSGLAAAQDPRLGRAVAAMAEVEPVEGRFRPRVFRARGLLFDDTYNANPKSVLAAIAATHEAATALGRPHVLVLGEMRELGAYAAESHDEVLRAALATRPRAIALVGEDFRAALSRAEGAQAEWFVDSAAASEFAKSVNGDDVVLAKGSRGVRMERFVEALLAS